RFGPDLILVSAGFDAFAADPLAELQVSAEGFARLAERLVRVADQVAGGRVAVVLEGGYDLDGLGRCARAVYEVLARDEVSAAEPGPAPEPSAAVAAAIDQTRAALAAARGEAP